MTNILTCDSSEGQLTHEAVHARLNIMTTQINHQTNKKNLKYKPQNYYITRIQRYKSTSLLLIWPDLHTAMLLLY